MKSTEIVQEIHDIVADAVAKVEWTADKNKSMPASPRAVDWVINDIIEELTKLKKEFGYELSNPHQT